MEMPEPIIFNATLEKVTLKRSGLGKPPEVVMHLSSAVKGEDLRHVLKMQEMYMQVAFAPAQAIMPLEPSAAE